MFGHFLRTFIQIVLTNFCAKNVWRLCALLYKKCLPNFCALLYKWFFYQFCAIFIAHVYKTIFDDFLRNIFCAILHKNCLWPIFAQYFLRTFLQIVFDQFLCNIFCALFYKFFLTNFYALFINCFWPIFAQYCLRTFIKNYFKNIIRGGGLDELFEGTKSRAKKEKYGKEEERENNKSKQIHRSLDKCRFCFNNGKMDNSLVSAGKYVYVAVCGNEPMTGKCSKKRGPKF